MAEQGGDGRTGRDVGPRHRAGALPRDSRILVPGREAGTAAVEEEDYDEREIAWKQPWFTPSFPTEAVLGICLWEGDQSLWGPGRNCCCNGDCAPWAAQHSSTIPIPLQQGRGTGLCVRLGKALAEGWSTSQRCTASLVLELKKEAAPEGTAPIPEQRWQGCSAPEWACGQGSELMGLWAVQCILVSAGTARIPRAAGCSEADRPPRSRKIQSPLTQSTPICCLQLGQH